MEESVTNLHRDGGNAVIPNMSGCCDLLEDQRLLEKLARFNRESIPPRVAHAKGAGAFGYFEVTNDLRQYCQAKLFDNIGKQTPLAVRFSTVNGERGSSDAVRDLRGFAVKFYTEDGNYDLVCNNSPVFFIRDAAKFPDLLHVQKRNPHHNLPEVNMFWDFMSLTPESLHQLLILFADRGVPRSYREMHGYSAHAFMWYNQNNEHVWVKYHLLADAGFHTLDPFEAGQLSGSEPDFAGRDLYDAIARGETPSWTVCVQIMTPEQAKKCQWDPFDVTKVWYHRDFPLKKLGKIVLNRNPANYLDEVEKIAFNPANFVPGIHASPDPLLHGRLLAYADAQRWRLGSDYREITVNREHHKKVTPSAPDQFHHLPPYWPNSIGRPAENPEPVSPVLVAARAECCRRPVDPESDYLQPREFYRRVLKDLGRTQLVSNLAGQLVFADRKLQYRQIAMFYKIDASFGTRLATLLKLEVKKVEELAAMSDGERLELTRLQPIDGK